MWLARSSALLALAAAALGAADARAAVGDITRVAGTGTAGYNGDNIQATTAQLSFPIGVARSAGGGFYLTDQANYRVRLVSASGVISTIAGNGQAGYTGDTGPATEDRKST